MEQSDQPGAVVSSEGLGLVERLRQCLPTMADGPDHKTWCSVLGTDLREAADEIERLRADLRLAWATKGFELDTGLLPHQVARAVLGEGVPIAVLSGPTFAREVGAGLPTAMVVASPDATFATALATSLSSSNFRAYTSTDIAGVEVGGAVKNVMAVGAGLSDGLGFGANTRIALITRGLVEMTRLGVALGAHRETFMGLAGLGDLVLTCTDDQSRNRRFGLALARGEGAEAALAQIGLSLLAVFTLTRLRIEDRGLAGARSSIKAGRAATRCASCSACG